MSRPLPAYLLFFLLFGLPLCCRAADAPPVLHTETGFLPNRGQLKNEHAKPATEAHFYLQRQATLIALTHKGLQMTQKGIPANQPTEAGKSTPTPFLWRADLTLENASPNARWTTATPVPTLHNFYSEQNANGILSVPEYPSLTLKQAWPNIDWHLKATETGLKHEFVLVPGADASRVQLRWSGCEEMNLTAAGGLRMQTPAGYWEEAAPVAYQMRGQDTSWVSAAFVIGTGGRIAFHLGDFDTSLALVIDPLVQVWGTYYGGTRGDAFQDVAIDPQSRYYWVGSLQSADVALSTAGTFQPLHSDAPAGGASDVSLSQWDVNGNRLWATYYGSAASADDGTAIAIDRDGSLFIAGTTADATGLFGTPGVCQPLVGGGTDAFVAKFDFTNGQRIWSTYLGGTGDERSGNDLALDECGNLLLAGTTNSPAGFVDLNGNLPRGQDAFVVKLRNHHGGCVWTQFIGGDGTETGESLDVEGCGEDKNFLYVGGTTDGSPGLATPGTHQTTNGGGTDGYIARLSNVTGQTIWLTYYGGSNTDAVNSLQVDACGFVYVAGTTDSPNAIASPGTHQPAFGGGTSDAFAAKFNSTGNRNWGTYYGGTGTEFGRSLSIEGCDATNFYITGQTQSLTGIADPTGFQTTIGGPSDGFAARLDGFNGTRRWGTYLGSNGGDGLRILKAWRGDVVIGGRVLDLGAALNATPPAVIQQGVSGGASDGFILLFTE